MSDKLTDHIPEGISDRSWATWKGCLSELSHSNNYDETLRKAEFCKAYALALLEAEVISEVIYNRLRADLEIAWKKASDLMERSGSGSLNQLMKDDSSSRKRAEDRQQGHLTNSDES